jgi:hypothetical protein
MNSSERDNNHELLPRDLLPYEQQQQQQQQLPAYNHSSSSSSTTSNYLRSSPAVEDYEGMKLFIGQVSPSFLPSFLFPHTSSLLVDP